MPRYSGSEKLTRIFGNKNQRSGPQKRLAREMPEDVVGRLFNLLSSCIHNDLPLAD